MKIKVTKDKVSIIEKDIVHAGEYNINHIEFEFSAEYTADLVKNAAFSVKDNVYQTSIINDQCDIPAEILSDFGEVVFGVYAYKVNDDQLELRYSPFPARFTIISGSYDPTANESQEITPSQYEQYMQALNDGLNKIEESLKKMDSATSSVNNLVDEINQKLENGDFIGPEGPQGVPGKNGTDGADGADGVGITTITSDQSSVEENKTITPVIVNKTDGSSQRFNVEAKNGIDGQNGKDGTNGQDGLTPTIGDNGNWYLGDTDTGKPSRGEVGPTPDLSDYVKNTDYANGTTGGTVKSANQFFVTSSNGYVYSGELSKEAYKSIGNASFISKGTLENVKDDYVGSSTPVQDLTATVTNVQNDQDASMPKQTASGEIVSINDALSYKSFEDKVDGASEQITTTGKNLFDTSSLLQTSTVIGTSTGNIYTLKPNTQYTISTNIVSNPNSDNGLEPVIGTPTSQNSFIFVSVDTNIEDVSSKNQGVGTTNNITRTLTTDDTGNIYVGVRGGFNNNLNNLIDQGGYVQIEEGSVATSYEPYTGGQSSPNQDYPQQIKTLTFDKITRCGKNLYELRDYDGTLIGMNLKIENQILTLDGISNNTWFSIGNIGKQSNIPRLKKDEDYTITFISTFDKDLNCTLWNDVGNVIIQDVQCNPVKANSKSSFAFKCSYDEILTNFRIAFAGFTVGEEVQGTMQIMIEQGSQATDYEPYKEQTYSIDLQGNEMVELPNSVKDELVVDKYGNVSLVKNVGKVVLDGSDAEGWNMIEENEKYRFSSTIIQNIVQPSTPCLSNYFMSGSADDGDYFVENTIEIAPSGGVSICTYAVSNSIDEWNTWLSTHNTEVYYQLANPQTIPLGKLIDIITTLNGTNNISINGNIPTTISTTYALDIKKYIDNKLAEIASAMIEEG